MSFAWRDYYDLAVDLGKRSDEASKRTAISRAYYSVYGLAGSWVEKVFDKSVRRLARDADIGTHDFVWNAIEGMNGGKHAALSQSGKRMKKARVHADYYPNYGKIDQELDLIILQADMALNEIEKWLKP